MTKNLYVTTRSKRKKYEQEDISEEDKKEFKKLIVELEKEVKKNHE